MRRQDCYISVKKNIRVDCHCIGYLLLTFLDIDGVSDSNFL